MKPNCIYDPADYRRYYPRCCHRLYCATGLTETKTTTTSQPIFVRFSSLNATESFDGWTTIATTSDTETVTSSNYANTMSSTIENTTTETTYTTVDGAAITEISESATAAVTSEAGAYTMASETATNKPLITTEEVTTEGTARTQKVIATDNPIITTVRHTTIATRVTTIVNTTDESAVTADSQTAKPAEDTSTVEAEVTTLEGKTAEEEIYKKSSTIPNEIATTERKLADATAAAVDTIVSKATAKTKEGRIMSPEITNSLDSSEVTVTVTKRIKGLHRVMPKSEAAMEDSRESKTNRNDSKVNRNPQEERKHKLKLEVVLKNITCEYNGLERGNEHKIRTRR